MFGSASRAIPRTRGVLNVCSIVLPSTRSADGIRGHVCRRDASVSDKLVFGTAGIWPGDRRACRQRLRRQPNLSAHPEQRPEAFQRSREVTRPPLPAAVPNTIEVPAATLNCQPTNCDHAQSVPFYAIKGHDHLVGMASTHGDFNVAWDVWLVVFTPQGFADRAIDNRILTLTALNAAITKGDVVKIPFMTPSGQFSFNCSITSEATYLKGTPLSFP